MPLAFRQIACDTPAHAAMLALRERILRKPIGLTVTAEEIARDKGDYLLGGFDGDDIVCCLILQKSDDGWVKMRQVAVDNTRQGQGIGAQMLAAANDVLRGWGVRKLGEKAPVDAKTIFQTGSTGKAMTAAVPPSPLRFIPER